MCGLKNHSRQILINNMTARHFTEADRESLYHVIRERRDMRHFIAGSEMDDAVLARILDAAHAAPSVGLMQPWRFIQIKKNELRDSIAALVEQERMQTARQMGEREAEFLRLKVEGLRECAALIAVVQAPDDGTVLGRRTMPEEMALCSTACAIQNMWLASRVENLGMGWVSFFDPRALADLLACPEGAKPVALLCIGPVSEFYDRPMLEQEGWRQGRALQECLFEDRWPE
ncbi:MAG: 5,6-dimethylbenzimidazole synthase [Gammaproteobacteria bacterium]|nr:5,6-dimethylbenzimidazole synthase [Gammaproteobacteria bacterium]